jgi:hypothetical protein
VLFAVGLLLVALVALLYASDLATLTYVLPPVPGSTTPNEHTTLWGPGVAVSALAVAAVAVAAAWTVWNLLRPPPRGLWWVAGGAVGLALLTTALVGSMSQPTF